MTLASGELGATVPRELRQRVVAAKRGNTGAILMKGTSHAGDSETMGKGLVCDQCQVREKSRYC